MVSNKCKTIIISSLYPNVVCHTVKGLVVENSNFLTILIICCIHRNMSDANLMQEYSYHLGGLTHQHFDEFSLH